MQQDLGSLIWEEWDGMEIAGAGIDDIDDLQGKIIYYAVGSWTAEDEDVMLGLVTTIQRDGVGLNKADSYTLVERARYHHGYAAPTSETLEDSSLTETDEDGRCMCHGYPVSYDMPVKMTWAFITIED